MEAARTSETSVDNHFTRQYNPEGSSEHQDLHILSLLAQSMAVAGQLFYYLLVT
jgi:hypothetical protein